jgi:hypothetical protein
MMGGRLRAKIRDFKFCCWSLRVVVNGPTRSGKPDTDESGAQSKRQQFQQEFQQLRQDLQSGNLSAARSDLATLQQNAPQGSPASGPSRSNSQNTFRNTSPIAQAFNQLSQDLTSRNLSSAQQDFATIQQDFQNQATQGQSRQGYPHHHDHGGGGGSDSGSSGTGAISRLGSALQSGNLSSAQQVYSSLQQDLLQYAQGGNTTAAATSTSSGTAGTTGVSITLKEGICFCKFGFVSCGAWQRWAPPSTGTTWPPSSLWAEGGPAVIYPGLKSEKTKSRSLAPPTPLGMTVCFLA